MTDPLSQLRAANPVPDAALDDAALTRSEAVLSDIVDSGSHTPWKAVAAGVGVLALVGGVIPFVNHSEPVAVAEVLTHAGEAAAAQPDAADKGVTSKEYLKRVDTDGSSTATTEYSVGVDGTVNISSQGELPGFDPQPVIPAEDLMAATDRAGLETLADRFPNRALGALQLLLQPGLSSAQQKIVYDILAATDGNDLASASQGSHDGVGEDGLISVIRDADHVSFSILPATGQLVRVVGLVGPNVTTTVEATAILGCVSVTGLEGPDSISLACGDNNYLVKDLKWSNWGADEATAEGTAVENDCDPFCAEGTFKQTPVRVVVDKREACGYNAKVYSRIRVIYPDHEEVEEIGCA